MEKIIIDSLWVSTESPIPKAKSLNSNALSRSNDSFSQKIYLITDLGEFITVSPNFITDSQRVITDSDRFITDLPILHRLYQERDLITT
ncbi:hypothetical protein NSQ43_00810 [Sporosarcina sp. FSL W8-0480]|uniref:hypothetical protein n=1 Tax=Sporosarcina sp. FSL W8-0480 TaxID=2954701 RepID=UPI0030DD6C33